jgi:hypothetical protein
MHVVGAVTHATPPDSHCIGALLVWLPSLRLFCLQLFGDSVDAHLAQQWCTLLQQPLLFTPTGLKGNVAAFAAAVKAKASGSSSTNDTATAVGAGSSGAGTADDAEGCCKDRDVFYYCKPKDPKAANRISLGMFHLPGVHLDGPFHTGVLDAETANAHTPGLLYCLLRTRTRAHCAAHALVGRCPAVYVYHQAQRTGAVLRPHLRVH